jgi:hypothetical protein
LAGANAARRDKDNIKTHNSLINHRFNIKIKPGGECAGGLFRVCSLPLPLASRVYIELYLAGQV